MTATNREKELRRVNKTRTRLANQVDVPRLSVFRSHKTITAQVIDDIKGVTLASVHSKEAADAKNRMEQAEKLGELIATKAKEKKVTNVRFDRGGNKYHGLVKAVAEGARKGGLVF